jgi:hypothetical protein
MPPILAQAFLGFLVHPQNCGQPPPRAPAEILPMALEQPNALGIPHLTYDKCLNICDICKSLPTEAQGH